MSERQDLFNLCINAYNDAIKLIEIMDQACQKHSGNTWDTHMTLAQFDLLLQAILLHIALADGHFDFYEQQFVDKITDHGDLMNFIKSKTDGELSFTWADINQLSREEQQSFLNMVDSWLQSDICDDFVRPLATLDSMTDKYDEMDMILRNVSTIAEGMGRIDGKLEQIEIKTYAKTVYDLIAERWQYYKNHVE